MYKIFFLSFGYPLVIIGQSFGLVSCLYRRGVLMGYCWSYEGGEEYRRRNFDIFKKK